MEFKFIKLKEYIDATTTTVEVDVACRLINILIAMTIEKLPTT